MLKPERTDPQEAMALLTEQLGALGMDEDTFLYAFSIYDNDRVPIDRAVELIVACHRSGKDPIEFARHFVSLRKAIRT